MAQDKLMQPTAEMEALLVKAGSDRKSESLAAMEELAIALTLPLREGVLHGDNHGGIFEPLVLRPGAPAEYQLDFITPGTESDFVAYTLPNAGYIPQRHVEGDYVTVPAFRFGAAIDWLRRYARDARWDIAARAMEVMRHQFVKKMNDDAWHTLIGAGVDRNILVFDNDASNGQFTKRLVSLMKLLMRRNGGGNSTSVNRGKLSDLYLSPEGTEGIRNWGVDQIDEVTRKEIFEREDDGLNRIFGVNLHDLDELGEGQEYQEYFTTELSGTMASGDVEICVGLDRTKRDSFVNPIRQEVQIHPDDTMHRSGRVGLYGDSEAGWAVLDGRRVMIGSF